jgi:predicted homoserine dehydrogenase-like protein
MEIYERLQALQLEEKSIQVGQVGCGQMGSGLVHVTNQMPGMNSTAIADIDINRPVKVFKDIGISKSDICITNKVHEAEDALRSGKRVVTEDALLLTCLESLDAVIEATSLSETGAQVAWNCIQNRKHIIMLNVETDVTIGPLLHRQAKSSGCVYTAASGDEPGVCKMLYNFAGMLGFEIVCLGKGKNNPIDYEATPDNCREDAEKKGMNPKMLSAFRDGSKTMVELAAMSNATGLVPDIPGMHGPKADVQELNKVLVPREDGGVLSRRGCVDYSTGQVAPGVFAIVTTSDSFVQTDMVFLSMGEGPYYTLFRPYHLCNIETPVSIAEAVLYNESTVVSRNMISEVATIAKRDLKASEKVGEIGSADIFGRTFVYGDATANKVIPLGLAPYGMVTKDIAKGELLTEHNFAPNADLFVFKLRRIQDAQLAMEGRFSG